MTPHLNSARRDVHFVSGSFFVFVDRVELSEPESLQWLLHSEHPCDVSGATFRMTVEDMKRLIGELGYEPHQRDNWYRLLN